MKRGIDFTSGKILSKLLLFAGPVLLALLLQSMYGAVDLLIVGKFASSADVSAVSTGSQIMMTITGLISSLCMGMTIYLGQKIGERRADEGGQIVGSGLVLFAVTGVILTILIPLLSKQLTGVMHAPAEAFDLTAGYIAICGGGIIVIIAYNLIGGIFRGIGDSGTPLFTVLIACICNVAGDLFLVAGLHLGAAGAAIATVASQTVSVLISLLVLRRRTLPFSLQRKDVRIDRFILRRITLFGAPIALEDLLVGLSFLVVLAIVNTLGLIASAGVGVAEKVCAFIMLIPGAFMQSMSAFVAQNHGAGKNDRAVRGLKTAIVMSTCFGFVMFYLSFFHGDLLCGLFAKDPDVVAAGFDFLKAYGIDCLLTCFLFCFIGFYNGLGHTGFIMIQGIAAAFLIRIPVAFVMCRLTGRLFYIGLGIPLSTVVQIAACFVFYFAVVRKSILRSS